MNCPHLKFSAFAEIARIQKSDLEPDVIVAYRVDLKVACLDCDQKFEFIGIPNGFSAYRPTVSIDGQTLSAPMVIPGTRPPEGMAGFSVTRAAFEEKEPVKQ